MAAPAFTDERVEAAFAAYPEPARTALLDLRATIFSVAGETDGVGRVAETLKWGEPAYLTPETKSGSTIRLGIPKKAPAHDHALFVNCRTDLIRWFETHYPGLFVFEGTRAVPFSSDEPVAETPLRHCIAMALTYHLRRKA